MPQFTVNPQRFDPYKNFKFRVKWDGQYVAGISKVSSLKRTTEVVEHREGADPSTGRKSPGRTKYDPITLERGVTHDLAFEQWANKVWNFVGGPGAPVSRQSEPQSCWRASSSIRRRWSSSAPSPWVTARRTCCTCAASLWGSGWPASSGAPTPPASRRWTWSCE